MNHLQNFISLVTINKLYKTPTYSRRGVDRLFKENKEVCDAHKKLGHPKLEKDIQYRILETGDLSPICKLIPELSSMNKLNAHHI